MKSLLFFSILVISTIWTLPSYGLAAPIVSSKIHFEGPYGTLRITNGNFYKGLMFLGYPYGSKYFSVCDENVVPGYTDFYSPNPKSQLSVRLKDVATGTDVFAPCLQLVDNTYLDIDLAPFRRLFGVNAFPRTFDVTVKNLTTGGTKTTRATISY